MYISALLFYSDLFVSYNYYLRSLGKTKNICLKCTLNILLRIFPNLDILRHKLAYVPR